jgi:uncharacterized SAM-binding protein YcdF (DUF218 family)
MDNPRRIWPWIFAAVVGSAALYAATLLLGNGFSMFLWGASSLALVAAVEIAVVFVGHW